MSDVNVTEGGNTSSLKALQNDLQWIRPQRERKRGWTNKMFAELDGWGQLCHTGIRAVKRKKKGAQMWGGLELRRLKWFTT